MAAPQPHPWLRGPVPGVPDLLQPLAHSLMQSHEEAVSILEAFPDELLWERPAGLASVGFHLRHMAGVIDRLFTLARGDSLSDEQRAAGSQEGVAPEQPVTAAELLEALGKRVALGVAQLRTTEVSRLGEARLVGARQLPTTAHGLLFHAADHLQRHTGQLLVTARVVSQGR